MRHMPELMIECSKSRGEIIQENACFYIKEGETRVWVNANWPFKQLGSRLKFIHGLALIGFPTTGSCNIFLPGI